MHKIWIDGAWVDADTATSCEIQNPATLAPLGAVPQCGASDIARALAAARAAEPSWRAMPATERLRRLAEVAVHVRAQGVQIARLLTQETGKPLCESFDDVDAAAAFFEHPGEVARGRRGVAQHAVAAAIGSFDFPLRRIACEAASALAAGSAVICKPPHENPLSNLLFAQAYAPLPRGVINVISGCAEAGMALLRELGAAEAASGAGDSNESIIVLDGADFDLAVPGVAWARLRNGGQNAELRQRIYVERPIAAAFADRIHEYVAFLEVGDPLKSDTDLGPLISHAAARRVEGQVAHAVKEGARLKLGGRMFRPWGLPGHFFQPTILTGVRRDSVAARESIAGPVLSIIPVADAAEALRFAREDGLSSAAIYANGLEVGRRADADVRPVTQREPWWFPYRDRKVPQDGARV